MLTTKFLQNLMEEARPIIERQLDDAELIAGLRDVFAAQGGDWGALKALIKSHIQDERDEVGDGKRIRKLRERAGNQTAYADMLGLGDMNEKNSFADDDQADADGVVEHITNSAAASNSADAPVPSGAAKEVFPDASFANSREDVADATTQGGDGFLTTSLDRAEGDEDGQPLPPQPSEAGLPVATAAGDNHPGGDHANSDGKAVASHAPDESTAARMDVRDNSTGEVRRVELPDPAAATTPPAGTQAPPVDTPSLTGSAADKSGEAGGVSPSASPAPTKLKMNAEFFEEPHSACQRPGFCGGNSNVALCDKCRAASGIDGHVHDADERVLN